MDAAEIERMNKASQSTSQQKARKLSHARMLRTKWRTWALQHQAIIKKMLRAQPHDRAAMQTVWDSLPPFGDQTVIKAADLSPDGESVKGMSFGWASADKLLETGGFQQTDDPKKQEMLRTNLTQLQARKQDNFEELRDIALATSFGQGNTNVTLWVSGRITEQRPQTQEERLEAIQKIRASGKPAGYSDLMGPRREVEPPYDFLQ
jgi:hypothetical protein